MDDVGLRGDEDFLLVHSVEDSAEYREEITHFNIDGDMIYNCLKDPRLTVAYDAHCLAFKGLANMHPGKAINPALLNNYLSDAFAGAGSLFSGGILRYRRPRRKREAGNLASIQFEIEVIPGGLSGGIGSAADVYGSAAWPNPASILTSSESTSPLPAKSLFGCTIFWRRKTTLSVGSVTIVPGEGSEATVTNHFQGLPATAPQPANLAAFLVSVDAYGDGNSDIAEVYHVPSGTTWFLGGSELEMIPALLLEPQDPRDYYATETPYTCRYIAKWAGATYNYTTIHAENYANLSAFQAVYPNNAERTLIWLFDARTNAYLFGP